MRKLLVVLALAAAMLAVPMNSAAATVVNMSDLHISLEIPTGWTYERNASSGGVTYDLEIQGPVSGGYQPYGLLDHVSWPGSVSDSTLWAEMKNEKDDARADPEASYVTIVSPATNGTINGIKCNDMTMQATYSGTSITMRIVILASDAWNTGWKLALGVVTSQWSSYSSTINTIVNSITVPEKTGSDVSMVMVGVGVLVIVVIVIAVVVLMMRRRDKGQEMMTGPPPLQPPYQPPATPPPPPPPGNP